MKSCEKGRSMIEMLGVLAIVGVLSVGGIKGYTRAMTKLKADKVISQINETVLNIRTLFINERDYSGISARLLINVNAIPGTMYDPTDTRSSIILKNALGGDILIFTSKDLTGGSKAFEVYATGLDRDTCTAMAVLDWGISTQGALEAMYVGTGDVTTPLLLDIHTPTDSIPEAGIFTPGMNDDSLPIKVTTAQKLCACTTSYTCVLGLKYT